VFVDEGYCSAAAVELDPDTGCATYSASDEVVKKDDDWDAEDDELEDWEEEDGSEDDDDWLEDEDEF
jgi:hypothetical protein